MLKNYFAVAWRKIRYNKSYFFINVFGLAIGIAACLIIFLVIQFETSFDNFHHNKESIYRVSGKFQSPDGVTYTSGSGFPVVNGLRTDYPELKKVAAIYSAEDMPVTIENEATKEQKQFLEDLVFFAEPEFFEIFNFPWLAGNARSGLSEPNTAALTQEIAEKYFGDHTNAIGKTIVLRNNRAYKITGILKNVPANTDFPLGVVLSYKSLRNATTSTDWISSTSNLNIYLQLPENINVAQFNTSLDAFAKRHKPAEYVKDGYLLQSLSTIHADSRFGNFKNYTFSSELVTALKLIGIFLLLIACVNFINLATAHAINRGKEVGIRKVLGSSKNALIIQFLAETFLICLFSTLIGLALARFSLPWVDEILQASISLQLDSSLYLFLTVLIVTVTLLSGFYPAIVLSGYNPIVALKSKLTNKATGGLVLRKALIVFQFVVAQALIIGTLIVVSQMNFFRNAPLGFDKNAILTVRIPTDSLSKSKIDAFKNTMAQQAGVKSVSMSLFVPSDENHWETDFRFDNAIKKTDFNADFKIADADHIKTYGFSMAAGRFYRSSDTINEFVVNEALVQKLGLKQPEDAIGKMIGLGDPEQTAPIVGVVKNFHSYALDKPISPVIMAPRKALYQLMSVKFDLDKSSQLLSNIEAIWKKTFPANIYEYEFLDDKMNSYYKQEIILSQLYKAFALIAVLISCLGIYGLISFMTSMRMKEISIRKVVGASVGNIVSLFLNDFMRLIVLGFAIAAPIAWYFMNDWLQQFAYRVKPGWQIFLLAVTISIIITCLTIGFKTIKIATSNPVKTLRTE